MEWDKVFFSLNEKLKQACLLAENAIERSICAFNIRRLICIVENKQIRSIYFQSERECRQHALYSHKARYNKPIRIPVRMVQIIWLAVQD